MDDAALDKSYSTQIKSVKGIPLKKDFRSKVIKKSSSNLLISLQPKQPISHQEGKIKKMYIVLKLSLHFLAGSYDDKGFLVSEEDFDMMVYRKIIKKKIDNTPSIELNLKEPKKFNLISEFKSELKAPKKSTSLLECMRSQDLGEIDEFLESATRISQSSKANSPSNKDKKLKNKAKQNVNITKKLAKDWKKKYQNNGPNHGPKDLRDILKFLMISKKMYENCAKIKTKILLSLTPLTDLQRTHLYLSMCNPSLIKQKLLDYEEDSYIFKRSKSRAFSTQNTNKKDSRLFGESVMNFNKSRGKLLSPLGNDFQPNLVKTTSIDDTTDLKDVTSVQNSMKNFNFEDTSESKQLFIIKHYNI